MYLLSARPNISTEANLPTLGFPAAVAKRVDQPPPLLLIVILSLSSLPLESIAILATGKVPLPDDCSIPLNDITGGLVYPYPGSTTVIDSNLPSVFDNVNVAVSPVSPWSVPPPTLPKVIGVPP